MTSGQATTHYYYPGPSHWQLWGALALLIMAMGTVVWMWGNWTIGPILIAIGVAFLVLMLAGWFHRVAHESESGAYNQQVDMSYRWSMSWFIFSEVMFFGAFFGALFFTRVISIPDLGSLAHSKMLWPNFTATWPTAGPGLAGLQFTPMEAWGIAAINTLILLTSGATVTWAHWGLKKARRWQLILGLILTITLGITFLFLQGYEYYHAYFHQGLTLGAGAYGATFFLLTGFHGFHVTVGTIMLIVILGRCLAGHFKPEHHFAFEGVSWYWHFVDVVWLLLFIFVYWLA
ncbi:MAG TPA: cytochrome c oxidase subunit 3 [Burkholderiales bacterium]|jgi:cytochrome c oxidase subunit 3|nr:cytochrome c oxidase subunit 3 [Burkholderiales bacterium]